MGSEHVNLLVVEDVEQDAELIACQLERAGFGVSCTRVDSVADLTAALEQQPWDVVFTEYTMPGLAVPKVLQLIQERQPTVPCILVSGTASEETARAAIKLGVD